MDIEELAASLRIENIPEFWKTNWQAFEEWAASGGCRVKPGDIPPNAAEVFSLPPGCMSELEAVCEEIRRNPALAKLSDLWHFLLFHLPGGRGLAEDILPPPTGVLGERAPAFRIAVLVTGVDDALAAYRAMGVEDRIVMDSLAQCGHQISAFHESHGAYGMRYLGWMRNYFVAKMFRLGRLVFNPNTYTWAFRVYRHRATGELVTLCTEGQKYRSDGIADGSHGIHDPDAWTPEISIGKRFVRGNPVMPGATASRERITLDTREWESVLTSGDPMIEIHIPPSSSGGRLGWKECRDSYRQALGFFPRTYPDTEFKVFTCWSWLLDPALPKILPRESNIVKFQSPFHLLPVVGFDTQCYDLVFGDPNLDITTVTPKTSLQRAIVDYVMAGNRMRSAAGFITIEEMTAISGSI